MKEIKSIPVVSFALIIALILAIIMFIIGILIVIFGLSMFSMMSAFMMYGANFMNFGAITALYWIVIMPLMMFICGFLIAALAAIIYNVLAPRIGGIKLELE